MASKQNIHLAAWARDLWERAAGSERGLCLYYETRKQAQAARFALYTSRNINREEMKEFYEKEDPSWGSSPWDIFRLVIDFDSERKEWALRLEHQTSERFKASSIEEL